MAIEQIETWVLADGLREPFSFSQWEYDQRRICIVRITDSSGQAGWGEGYGPANVIRAGIDFFAPLLVGRDPLQSAVLWQDMLLRSLDYARSGVMVGAISAIDVALWDLKGKILGQPVHALLGGARRKSVRVYATGMYFTPGPDLPARLADEARDYAEQGFDAIKMKVGLGLDADIQNVRAVREAVGPKVRLMIDANHAYALMEALRLARELEQYDIAWFEEPLSPEEYAGYRELRARTAIPLAAGECEYLAEGFSRLLNAKAVDICQPDICACGGLTEVQRIAALARVHGAWLLPHSWGTGIAFSAALHFASTLHLHPGRLRAAEPLLEMDRTENPLRDELTSRVFAGRRGEVAVPDAPGLGVQVNEEAIRKFTDKEKS